MSKKIMWAILALLTAVPTAEARMGVGNGDGIKLLFAKAREHAAFITLRLNDRSLAKNLDVGLRDWILANRQELAADIAKTKHKWIETATPACAATHYATGAEIELSYPTCRSLNTFEDAGMLLVHESVHHLDVADENFADAVALAIYGSWRGGGTDWVATARAGAPSSREHHSAVVTDGGDVIVFGGLIDAENFVATNTGAKYDPDSDTWTAISSANVAPRVGHQAVFTGSQMIVWGGFVKKPDGSLVWQNSGAVYDLASNTWASLRSPFGPYELSENAVDLEWAVQQLVWTGREVIIYGGGLVNGKFPGGIYTPGSTNNNGGWRSLTGTSAPLRTAGQSAVWADDRLIVWGGKDLAQNLTNYGASFDLSTNKWTTLSTVGAPSARALHSAVWTGNSMIVFGGWDSGVDLAGTVGIYTPATNSWKTSRSESVQARYQHAAVWTGSEMLVYGGRPQRVFKNYLGSVGAFNPINGSWRTIEASGMPLARGRHTATWTGASMVVFGGVAGSIGGGIDLTNTGGVFYP